MPMQVGYIYLFHMAAIGKCKNAEIFETKVQWYITLVLR